jgi:hypothetical protein
VRVVGPGGPWWCAPVRRDSRRAAAARVLSIVVRVVEVGEEAVCLWRARVSGLVALFLLSCFWLSFVVRWLRSNVQTPFVGTTVFFPRQAIARRGSFGQNTDICR